MLLDTLVRFIDNAEDRMVIEYEAEYCEKKFMTRILSADTVMGFVPTDRIFAHLGLGVNWSVKKWEYTGESYIITIERMWV